LLPAIEIATKLGKNLTEMVMVDGQRCTTPYSSKASKSLEYTKPKVAYNFSTHQGIVKMDLFGCQKRCIA
jgi:hypothetical protein